MSGSSCIFCRIAAGEIPSRTAGSSENWYAFHDLQPQAPTHVLVVPRKHIATLNDLTPGDAALAGELLLAAQSLTRELGIREKGYRLVWNCGAQGGQTVFHIHLHLLGGRQMTWPPG